MAGSWVNEAAGKDGFLPNGDPGLDGCEIVVGEGEGFVAVAGRHLKQEGGFPGRNEADAVVDVKVVPSEVFEGVRGELMEAFLSQRRVTGVAQTEQRAAFLDSANDPKKSEHSSVFGVLMGRRRIDGVAGDDAGNQRKTRLTWHPLVSRFSPRRSAISAKGFR